MKAFSKITGFINEVKVELGKVSWSTREELIASTSVVISLTALLALFIFFVDSALAKILSIIFKA
jgi:preprotein translocase subunit SecE